MLNKNHKQKVHHKINIIIVKGITHCEDVKN